ncbi:hypothetical protein ACIODX_09590 [Streptomyces sp. NPDC088190]|uniref:hypothetical protein n=1 Tax=unclassified Streptomyces TaxID=2593676 RepID=UPI0033947BC7
MAAGGWIGAGSAMCVALLALGAGARGVALAEAAEGRQVSAWAGLWASSRVRWSSA